MSDISLVTTADGHICGTHDWVRGFVPLKCPHRPPTERDVFAQARRLERLGFREEAYRLRKEFLDRDG